MTGSLAVLLAPLVVVGFEDRVETRVRTFGDGAPRVDLVESASLQLSISGQRNSATIGYAPMLLLLSVGTPEQAVGFAQAFDGTVNHTYRRGFVSLQQSAVLARNNLRLTLVPQPLDPAGPSDQTPTVPLPPGSAASGSAFYDTVVWFGSTRTSLALGQTLSPRLRLHESASYSAHGGLGSATETLYPRQYQQAAGAGLSQTLTRRDTLTHGLDAQRTTTSGRAQVYVLSLRETWAHVFSSATSGQLAAGLAYAREADVPEEGREPLDTWLPVGEASLMSRWSGEGARAALTAAVGVAPTVDWLSGRLDQRGYVNLAFTEERRRFTWFVGGSGMTSLDQSTPNALTIAAVAAGASQRWSREISVDANVTASRQLFGENISASTLWMAFAGITYRPNPWRL